MYQARKSHMMSVPLILGLTITISILCDHSYAQEDTPSAVVSDIEPIDDEYPEARPIKTVKPQDSTSEDIQKTSDISKDSQQPSQPKGIDPNSTLPKSSLQTLTLANTQPSTTSMPSAIVEGGCAAQQHSLAQPSSSTACRPRR